MVFLCLPVKEPDGGKKKKKKTKHIKTKNHSEHNRAKGDNV